VSKIIKNKLIEYRCRNRILKRLICTKEEAKEFNLLFKSKQPLPEGVYRYGNIFYRVSKLDLTEQEINEYLMSKQLDSLDTIKNCLLFFVIAAIASLFVSFIIITLSSLP
jgi:hypothetical protein